MANVVLKMEKIVGVLKRNPESVSPERLEELVRILTIMDGELENQEEPPSDIEVRSGRENSNSSYDTDDEAAPPDEDEAAPSDEDDEAPPLQEDDDDIANINQSIHSEPTVARHYAERARIYLHKGMFVMALNDAKHAVNLNPNSAKSHRILSLVQWKMSKPNDAFMSMCEAQRIDYDEEYSDLHDQMKTSASLISTKDTKPPDEMSSTPPPAFPDMSGINLNDLMQNPEVMKMANNMMQNPDFIQQMMANFRPS